MSELTILAIDTSTECCSVALKHQGKIYDLSEVAPQKHAALVLPMIDELMKKLNLERSDLDLIAYGAGPGSFTGVRIAVSTAQALALGLNLKVWGQSDLKLLVAEQMIAAANKATAIATADVYGLACIDARMGEVYMALYRLSAQTKSFEAIISEQVVKPEQALSELLQHKEALGSLICAGTGIAILDKLGLSAELKAAGNSDFDLDSIHLYPEARALLFCADMEQVEPYDPSLAEPLYCRNEVTWKKIGEQ